MNLNLSPEDELELEHRRGVAVSRKANLRADPVFVRSISSPTRLSVPAPVAQLHSFKMISTTSLDQPHMSILDICQGINLVPETHFFKS